MRQLLTLRYFFPVMLGIFSLAVIAITYVANYTLAIAATEKNISQDLLDDLSSEQGILELLLSKREHQGIQSVIAAHAAKLDNLFMLVADPQGIVIASTSHQHVGRHWRDSKAHLSEPDIQKVLTNRTIELNVNQKEQTIDGYISLCPGGNSRLLRQSSCGFLARRADLALGQKAVTSNLTTQAIFSSAGILFIAITLGMTSYLFFGRRAAKLSQVMGSFALGQTSLRTNLQGNDEISVIGRSVDQMLDKIAKNEASIMSKNSRLKTLFNTVDDAILSIEITDFNIVDTNHAADKIFGYASSELTGIPGSQVLPELFYGTIDELHTNFSSILMSPDVAAGESKMNGNETSGKRQNGNVFPAEYSINRMNTNDCTELLLVVRDITERKRAEKMLFRHQNQLESLVQTRTKSLEIALDQAEHANSAKSEFLSRMSHELRTPLNAIVGFGQLMHSDEDQPLTALQSDNLEEITRASQQLLELVNEVLDLSRIESGQLKMSLEPVELAALVQLCINQCLPLTKAKNIEVSEQIADHCVIKGDYTRLRQVILNLLTNAIKYNKANGYVRINASTLDDQIVSVSIEDNGIGIPTEAHSRLFKPFERLESAYDGIEGTGIGLALVKNLIEAMDGKVGFNSEEGTGSTFWFTLPATNLPVVLSDQRASIDKPKILYIEDNPANLRLVNKILSVRNDVEIIEATDAETGLKIAQEEPLALILMDLNLPGMDGFNALRKLKATTKTKDIPVIAVTANAMTSDITRGKTQGFDDYITKPIDMKKFNASIDLFVFRK